MGLEAQKTQVQSYVRGGQLIEEYTDVETGKGRSLRREGLIKAIEHVESISGVLVIAKLDRLARNVNFVSALLESSINFIACDMPEANKFTIHIFSALAEQEADLISQRTKAALAELKKKGVRLGKPENLTENARKKGLEVRKNNAHYNENNSKAGALIVSLQKEGITYSTIAKELNRLNFKTRRGKLFSSTQVIRLFHRYRKNIHP